MRRSYVRAVPLPAQIGERVGDYLLEEVIGRGGMGCVYLGRHVAIPRLAAVKVLGHPPDEELSARFFREARIVNDVHHPNLVEIHDLIRETHPPRLACVMEALPGETLARFLSRRRPTLQQAKAVFAQLASALAAVHSTGFVHRDLKPGNVMLLDPEADSWDEVPSVKLLDFGVAGRLAPGGESGLSQRSPMMLGTPAYMAPEQISGGRVSAAADAYALAEIGVEMITGQRVFPGSARDALAAKVEGHRPVLPDEFRGRPRALLERALSAEPRLRPSLAELADAYESLDDGPSSARAEGHDLLWAAGAAATFVIGALLGLAELAKPESTSAPPASRSVAATAATSPEPAPPDLEAAVPAPEPVELAPPASASVESAGPTPSETPRGGRAELAREWTVQCPPEAHVWRGDRDLGPCPLRVVDASERLTVRASGYYPQSLDMKSSSPGTLRVELRPIPEQPMHRREVPKW